MQSRMAKAWSKWRELSLSDLRQGSSNEIEAPDIPDSDSADVCETWPISVKDDKCMATTETIMVRCAMGLRLVEHRRNEVLEETKEEPIAIVVRMGRLEWCGHVGRRDETENDRAVVEMKMERKRTRWRPTLRWKDTVRGDLKAWNIREEWATDRERWKCICMVRYPAHGDSGER